MNSPVLSCAPPISPTHHIKPANTNTTTSRSSNGHNPLLLPVKTSVQHHQPNSTSKCCCSCFKLSLAATAAVFNPQTALAAAAGAADDPLCLGFAGDKTYTVIIIACILQAIALIGAAVGGNLARQRKLEVEKINGQLRQIFAKMRRQYQVETYAPSLTYAPAPAFISRVQDVPSPPVVDPAKQELIQHLKAGKKYLREKKPEAAFDEFQKSLLLARELNNRVEEKKAARGLGASCQRQKKYQEAIKYHSTVLTVSHLTGEHSGYTEALGAIADCYTELGDLENAAKFYDQYIARLDNDE